MMTLPTLSTGKMVEVGLPKPDNFLIVRETLTRIGLPCVLETDEQALTQLCHILHKQGRYFIVHYKELFALDGRHTILTDEDRGQRNAIAKLLTEWNLVTMIDADLSDAPEAPIASLKIVPFHHKGDWTLLTKYRLGKKPTPRHA